VPDLLAHFDHARPLLIEVKVKKARTLSFKTDYLAKLQAYADPLGIPLLIVWKYHGILNPAGGAASSARAPISTSRSARGSLSCQWR